MARILVADDDAGVRAAVHKALTGAGHAVAEAVDGGTVLDLYAGQPYDLLLIDLYMLPMDGLETIIRLKRDHPDARIVAISGGGYRDKHDVLTMAIRAGAQATLAKPFELDDLVETVRRALGSAPPAPQPAEPPSAKATVLLSERPASWLERVRNLPRRRRAGG